MNSITVRLATVGDAPELLAIYAPYVTSTPITFEYEVPSVTEFETRIKTVSDRFPWLVCEADGKIAGYAYISPHYERAAYQWDAELSIYLSEAYHRLGIALNLYKCLFELAAAQGYCNLYSLITVPNEPSMGLHAACGFHPVGTYPHTGYKFGTWYDMCVLEKPLRDFQESFNPQPTKSIQDLNPALVAEALKRCENNILKRGKYPC